MMAVPKVFSLFKTDTYEKVFPNVSILGNKVDFYLECNSYDVILPVNIHGEKKLDVFEEAVLKFLAFKSTNINEIAEILCLSTDLINFIIIRLQEMNLLTEKGTELTELGKQYISADSKISDKDNIDYIQAKLFVLPHNGKILPYIHKGEFLSDTVNNVQESVLTVEYGTEGNPIRIKGKVLRQSGIKEKRQLLQSSEIREALKRFNRLAANNVKFDTIGYAKGWAIDNTVSDNVCFHMQAVIQNGNVDELLLSDGFLANIDSVNEYIKKYHSDFIDKVKERATRNIIASDEENKTAQGKKYNNKYWELQKLISEIRAFAGKYLDEEQASPDRDENQEVRAFPKHDENQKIRAEQKKFLLNCYSAFEWSLYYYDLQNPLNSYMKKVVENQTAYQNEKTIIQMAQKIGINKPEQYDNLFFSLDSRRIKRMYKNTSPELRTALGIAIISSAESQQCGFRDLINIRSDLLNELCKLNSDHGNLSHQTATFDIDKPRDKYIFQLLLDFIECLQPDFEQNDISVNRRQIIPISQERLNAEVSLSRKMGAMYYYDILPESIREEWILVSPDKINYPDTAEYFDILYRIMQDSLFFEIKNIQKNPQLTKKSIIDFLSEKGIKSKCFDTLNEGFVNQILINENSTLGANAIVYLYYQNDNTLKELQEKGFISIVEQLVLLRKHGNNISLSIDLTRLNKIRDDMLEITKIIGEI